MQHLQTAVVPAPNQVVVRLTGDVDASTAPRVTRALREAAALGRDTVVVDVAGARFRDHAGLQALGVFTDALAPVGRRCRIVGAPAVTRRLVRSSGLESRLELDGPVDQGDPSRAVPPPQPRTHSPARRPSLPSQMGPARRVEEWPARRRLRPGPQRRWR